MTEVKPPSMQLFAGLKVRAVVQMQGDGDVGALDDGRLHQLHQIGVVGVGPGAWTPGESGEPPDPGRPR